MRTPREGRACRAPNASGVLPLDVTKPQSIAAGPRSGGPLDVLVNNAGIGSSGGFEATPMATAREMFETNTFGAMAMTQAVLPRFRARTRGRRGERDLERNARADAAGGRVHRDQDGGRRVHRFARFSNSRPSTSARSSSNRGTPPPRASRTTATRGASFQALRAVRPARLPFGQLTAVTTEADVAAAVWRAAPDPGAAPLPGRCGRGGAGAVEVTGGRQERATSPHRANERTRSSVARFARQVPLGVAGKGPQRVRNQSAVVGIVGRRPDAILEDRRHRLVELIRIA